MGKHITILKADSKMAHSLSLFYNVFFSNLFFSPILQLSQLFRDGSLGNKINVVLVGLILLEGDEVRVAWN